MPDNDDAGRKHAEVVAKSPQGIARVRVLELLDLPPKGDVVDWQNAGGTREQLDTLTDGKVDGVSTLSFKSFEQRHRERCAASVRLPSVRGPAADRAVAGEVVQRLQRRPRPAEGHSPSRSASRCAASVPRRKPLTTGTGNRKSQAQDGQWNLRIFYRG